MRLLVDECCDPRMVAALRQAGHDVRYALETDRGIDDENLLALCVAENRVLVTEDKDFGELTIRHGKPIPGMILLRFAPEIRHRKAARLLSLLARHGDQLTGSYAVLDQHSVRLRPLPPTGG